MLLAAGMIISGCGKNVPVSRNEETEDISRPAEEKSDEEAAPPQEENGAESMDEAEAEAAEVHNQPAENRESTKDNEDALPSSARVDLQSVRSEIVSECSIEDPLMLEAAALENLYAINAADVKQAAGFATMSGTFPHEVVMVEAADDEAAARVAELLQKRLDEVLNQAKSYDAQNYALAQECSVMKSGSYAALFLSPEHEAIAEVYCRFVK